LEAIRCAIALQSGFHNDPKVPVRIGIHSGTVVTEGDKVYGDSVNIASRIESMGIPGAILVSKKVRDELKNQPDLLMPSLGSFEFKNVEEPMEVFALANEGFAVPKRDEIKGNVTQKIQPKSNWLIPLLSVIVILIGGGYYFFSNTKNTAPKVIDAISIFPFDIKSGNPEIQYLSKGIVDLISTKLEGVPNLNPIDPNRIFNELTKAKEEVPVLETATEISNTLGAAEFILGSIIEINDALQISASKYNSTGDLMARENIEGQKTQLATLIDDLTRALIADKLEKEGQELNSIAMMTSEKLPALKAYLEGEQSYRKTNFPEAVNFFETAISLDSTFAMAWLRLYNARGWGGGGTVSENALDKAIQFSDKLPPKWQDIIKVQKLWQTGMPGNEDMIAGMLRKYGENPELTNLLAEHIFHYYPIYGRSFTEAKPWLEKSSALDPQNLETFRHQADIAWAEGDEVALQEIIEELPSNSRQWIINKIRLLTFQDTITETQVKEVTAHPRFGIFHVYPREAIPENPNLLLELVLRFEPYIDNEVGYNLLLSVLAQLRGKEREAIARRKIFWKTNPPDDLRTWARHASIIASRIYLPYEDLYQMYLDSLADSNEPRALFASAKYAWALGQEGVYEANKEKLTLASKQNLGVSNSARYYLWTLAAFETHQQEDYKNALVYIDSAFSYCPTERYQIASEAAMDKIFMLADIYEEKQEYGKGIQRLENLPMWGNYHESKGYATYRLTQLYEKNGDINKALAKCNLFWRNYKDCDERFRPWYNEVAERQQKLIAQVN
jgi:TolB-like protein